jgi:hypothetical protein
LSNVNFYFLELAPANDNNKVQIVLGPGYPEVNPNNIDREDKDPAHIDGMPGGDGRDDEASGAHIDGMSGDNREVDDVLGDEEDANQDSDDEDGANKRENSQGDKGNGEEDLPSNQDNDGQDGNQDSADWVFKL